MRIKGKFIIGVDEDDTDINTANKTGGTKKVTLTPNDIPPISLSIPYGWEENASWESKLKQSSIMNAVDFRWWTMQTNGNENNAHENMPPFIAKYCWERIE